MLQERWKTTCATTKTQCSQINFLKICFFNNRIRGWTKRIIKCQKLNQPKADHEPTESWMLNQPHMGIKIHSNTGLWRWTFSGREETETPTKPRTYKHDSFSSSFLYEPWCLQICLLKSSWNWNTLCWSFEFAQFTEDDLGLQHLSQLIYRLPSLYRQNCSNISKGLVENKQSIPTKQQDIER